MKTVLVTGGARGIGSAASECFAKNGYLTLINYNKSEREAFELAARLNGSGCLAELYKADLTDRAQIDKMFDSIYQKHKKIDCLVNNAGVSLVKEFLDITENEWDELLNINLKSVFLCSQRALEVMLKNNAGSIINISSMWGLTGSSCEVAYSASKAAVIGFTKALAKEVSPSGVRVNAVAPGLIDTLMNCDLETCIKDKLIAETPLNRIGDAEDVANAVLFLASDRAKFITGEVLNVSGGLLI